MDVLLKSAIAGTSPLGAVAGDGASLASVVSGAVVGAIPAGLSDASTGLSTVLPTGLASVIPTVPAATPTTAPAAVPADVKDDIITKFINFIIRFIAFIMQSFAPSDLANKKENSRILLNVIMLYAINYIYKYDVKQDKYKILIEIRENLNIYKDFLKENIKTLSKDYLDIVHDAVEDIKLNNARLFETNKDQKKIDSATKTADADRSQRYITSFANLLVNNSSGFSGSIFTTITSTIANIWRVMMVWSNPFAGFVLLVVFITIIILIFFGEDDTSTPETSGGGETGSLVPSPNIFGIFSNMEGGGANNNNTDIFSVLQRFPQNMFAFINKLSASYSRFSNYMNSSSDFMNSLTSDAPVTIERTEILPTREDPGLYDNIYTFDYNYINSINPPIDTVDNIGTSEKDAISNANTHVYNIRRPKKSDGFEKISKYYNISHNYKYEKVNESDKEYIYAPRCDGATDYVDNDCTIKQNNCGEITKKEDTSDYKNIII